jgi:hypothetical protein
LGYPVPGGSKYRNLALQVGEVSDEKGSSGDARQKVKSTDRTSRQRGNPTSTSPKLSKNKEKMGKICLGSQTFACYQDRLTD